VSTAREGIEHLMGLWTREPPYRIEGEFYRTNTERFLNSDIGVGAVIQPLQKPHPPIVITSIRPGSEGPFLAGSRDQTGISATYVGSEVVRTHIQKFSEGRSSAGLPPDPTGWRVARSIFVAEDEETAVRYAHDEDGPYGFYFRVMMTKLRAFGGLGVMRDHPEQPDSELSLKRVLERLVIAGTPETVAARLGAPERRRSVRDTPVHGPRLGRRRAVTPLDGADGAGSLAACDRVGERLTRRLTAPAPAP
jgi:alkanesulfonate monooxygenase SsuD/methylene tetrahydromethanopterin reductase-like flavin-dependent oxidoreductase (luciferase family)